MPKNKKIIIFATIVPVLIILENKQPKKKARGFGFLAVGGLPGLNGKEWY